MIKIKEGITNFLLTAPDPSLLFAGLIIFGQISLGASSMKRVYLLSLVVLLAALTFAAPVRAQDTTPSVTVTDQFIQNNRVFINSVYSAGPGFMVIHSEDPTGGPGPVIGNEAVAQGWTYNLEVKIDPTQATPTLYAMLHVDDNTVGVYEFGQIGGADAPALVNGEMVTPAFKAEIINADDQFVQNNQVVIASVTTQQAGFIVVHSGNVDTFGNTLGQAAVPAGTSTNITVPITAEGQTPVLWPMLHVDTGAVGTYEFGTVEGADPPVFVNDTMATLPIWTVPHMRVSNQLALAGDGQPVSASAFTLRVDSVLSEGPGFMVIHQETDNTFGPVAGFAPVPAGLTKDLVVELNAERVTYRMWPMLHTDTGVVGTYEFGQVEGADPPVLINDQVLTFPINAGPGLVLVDQEAEAGSAAGKVVITVNEATIDQPGWIAIHSNDNGNPGPVLGVTQLHRGSNKNVTVEIDGTAAGTLVMPMLHYDTGAVGVYEFGTVEGADPPVLVGGTIIMGPLNLTAASPEAGVPQACTITASQNVNLRAGPGIDTAQQGTLAAGQSAPVTGQVTGGDGYVWFQLQDGTFVRSDLGTTSGACGDLPAASSTGAVPEAPAPTTAPAATAAPTAVPAPTTAPAASNVVTVEVQDFQFVPASVTVPVGGTVRFVFVGQAPHSATADNGTFDSGLLNNGQEFSVTLSAAGTIAYHCQLHGVAGGGGMSGTIIVQ